MSQAHVDALIIARRIFSGGYGFQFYFNPSASIECKELHNAVIEALEGADSLYGWLRKTHGSGDWDGCSRRVFDVKIRATHLAWIDQMIIDWKGAP